MEKAVQALLIVWISPMEQMGWFQKELYPLRGEAIYYRSPWGVSPTIKPLPDSLLGFLPYLDTIGTFFF